MKSYHVYIMSNRGRNVFYTGVTGNIFKRVEQHQNGTGSKFTSKYRCRYLVYLEEFFKAREAIAREKNLKNWHRQWKLNLIQENNPEMIDLSSKW